MLSCNYGTYLGWTASIMMPPTIHPANTTAVVTDIVPVLITSLISMLIPIINRIIPIANNTQPPALFDDILNHLLRLRTLNKNMGSRINRNYFLPFFEVPLTPPTVACFFPFLTFAISQSCIINWKYISK